MRLKHQVCGKNATAADAPGEQLQHCSSAPNFLNGVRTRAVHNSRLAPVLRRTNFILSPISLYYSKTEAPSSQTTYLS